MVRRKWWIYANVDADQTRTRQIQDAQDLVKLLCDVGPISLHVETYGSGRIPDHLIKSVIKDNFDLRPGVIVKDLKLDRPIYLKTAAFGHFGRKGFSWEEPKVLKLNADAQAALSMAPGN